ncbi:MAG TPA: ABC transporter permease [Candidatus Dormibacteraeota bacterium]|nr:ABC transporter permease [Candidatus Dormibacteraeota bacterium]
MKLYRISALVERDMRKFFRSPTLMMVSMIFPLVQLIVLGYAFGGKIKGVDVAMVNNDHGPASIVVRQMLNAVATGPGDMRIIDYPNVPLAVHALRDGIVRGVVLIPINYSRRVEHQDNPRLVFIEDNTDQFLSNTLEASMQGIVQQLASPVIAPRLPPQVSLDVVEIYPYIQYIKYLLPGAIAMSIFIVAMIGGGITYIDDKSRGLHEGYLVTPIEGIELVFGLNLAGTIKGLMAGMVITLVGSLIAGVSGLANPVKLFYLMVVCAATALAMISFMFVTMVRVDDPMVPRAIFGVLNTLLFFPSGAIYPIQGFPKWMQAIAVIDPFYYSVHAFRNLLLKNVGFAGFYQDLLVLMGMSVLFLVMGTLLFRRQF